MAKKRELQQYDVVAVFVEKIRSPSLERFLDKWQLATVQDVSFNQVSLETKDGCQIIALKRNCVLVQRYK